MSSLIFSLPAIFIRNTFCPLSSAVDIGSVLRMMICSRCSIWENSRYESICNEVGKSIWVILGQSIKAFQRIAVVPSGIRIFPERPRGQPNRVVLSLL